MNVRLLAPPRAVNHVPMPPDGTPPLSPPVLTFER